MGFFCGVGNACLTNIIIYDILILLSYEFMKVSELIKLLQRNQCYLLEHGKEHDKWHSGKTGKDIRIPRHLSKEIPSGTANRILKDAGLK